MAMNSDTTSVSLKGARNGEVTSVEIMVAPSGRTRRIGSEAKA